MGIGRGSRKGANTIELAWEDPGAHLGSGLDTFSSGLGPAPGTNPPPVSSAETSSTNASSNVVPPPAGAMPAGFKAPDPAPQPEKESEPVGKSGLPILLGGALVEDNAEPDLDAILAEALAERPDHSAVQALDQAPNQATHVARDEPAANSAPWVPPAPAGPEFDVVPADGQPPAVSSDTDSAAAATDTGSPGEPGWYPQSGDVIAYWDGQAWSERRVLRNGEWVTA